VYSVHAEPGPFVRSTIHDLQTEREQFEKQRILSTLEDQQWNQSATARILGISEGTLRYKLNKWGIQRPK
jgi:DNA-binding NtrC family response regulator